MNTFESYYKSLIKTCLKIGHDLEGRNGMMRSLISTTLGASSLKPPIITGKKILYKKAIAEFVWMLEGRTDLEFLHEHNIYWWDDYAKDGHVHKSYGYQLRNDPDQIEYVLSELRKPYVSRRARISLWQPRDLKEQSIPCCYTEFDFIKREGKLQMIMTFRSSDLFLGFPYDALVGYLLLEHIAKQLDMSSHSIIYNFINVHLYHEHFDAVSEYLEQDEGRGSLIINDPSKTDGIKINIENQGPFIPAKLIL